VNSAIVQVDAAPFKQWYLTHCGVDIGRKKKMHVAKKDATEVYSFNLRINCCLPLEWIELIVHELLYLVNS
jgi:hypothetical protein